MLTGDMGPREKSMPSLDIGVVFPDREFCIWADNRLTGTLGKQHNTPQKPDLQQKWNPDILGEISWWIAQGLATHPNSPWQDASKQHVKMEDEKLDTVHDHTTLKCFCRG